MDIHQTMFTGNLGRDPEMRYAPNGKPVTSFSVGSNRTWTSDNGQKMKETVWTHVSIWGAMAEACNQYLKKGSKVLVVGRLKPNPETGGPRIWTGRDDGQPHATYELLATYVQFLSPAAQGSPLVGADEFGGGNAGDDEIPF